MGEDSYWTTGAIADRAQALAVQKRIAVALEKIAKLMEGIKVVGVDIEEER